MTLEDLLAIVENSTVDDWSRIDPAWPTGMPHYSSSFGLDGHVLDVDEHEEMAVLRQDVAVTLAWGLEPDGRQPTPRQYAWQSQFTDPSVVVALADIRYNGATVYRAEVVYVDGARCILPLPTIRFSAGTPITPEATSEQVVTRREVAFTRLLHHFSVPDDPNFDGYLQRSGFIVEE